MRALLSDMSQSDHPGKATVVIGDNENASGLSYANSVGIKTLNIEFKQFKCRDSFENRLITELTALDIEVVCLAGFMRILSKKFVHKFRNKIINIHPSLLPFFKGLKTHNKVLQAGMAIHGVTVHKVTEELDSGQIIGQAIIPVLQDDTPESLAKRLLPLEHRLYKRSLRNFILKETKPFLLDHS